MGSRRSEQLEELEGFLSMLECFDGSLEFEQPDGEPIHGKIRIDLPLLEKPVTVFAEIGVEVHYRAVQALEYCTLLFSLPDAYPSVAPSIDIECSWMSSAKVASVQQLIADTATSYEDQPMLYAIAFAVREHACENIEKMIRVDNTPYCIAKGIDGHNMLHRLVEAAAAIEQAAFERECHDCEVCFENEPGSRCVRFLPCRHVYCARCVQQYFVGLLKTEGIRTFECLADSCSAIAAQDVVRRAIGEEEFERYESILLERALGAMDDMAICPREACGKYVVINPLNRQLGRCDACALAFCIICRKTYHGVEGCRWQIGEKLKLLEEYEKGDNTAELEKRLGGKAALEKMISNLQNDKWVLENSKKCPKCKSDIEKNNGCNKMKCAKCGTAFCWLCLKRLDVGDPYKHFSEATGACANRLFEGMDEEAEAYFFQGEDDDEDGSDFDDFYDDAYEDGEPEFDIEDLYDDPEDVLAAIMGDDYAGDLDDVDYDPADVDGQEEDFDPEDVTGDDQDSIDYGPEDVAGDDQDDIDYGPEDVAGDDQDSIDYGPEDFAGDDQDDVDAADTFDDDGESGGADNDDYAEDNEDVEEENDLYEDAEGFEP